MTLKLEEADTTLMEFTFSCISTSRQLEADEADYFAEAKVIIAIAPKVRRSTFLEFVLVVAPSGRA